MTDENKPALLLVEDTLTQALRLSRVLSEKYAVRLARDAKEALQILEDYEPVVILSDINMPEMDGYELSTRLKNDPARCHIPFVLMIFPLEKTDALKALESGADDLIGKIFDAAYLLESIAEIIKNHDQDKNQSKSGDTSQKAVKRLTNMLISAMAVLAYHNVNSKK